MKIAVMGAGAIGCYFGARLAATGNDVHFIARGAHLRAMRENGLRIVSPHGDLHLETVNATQDAAEIGQVDMVLFCLKLWDTDLGAELIRPLLGEGTGIYSFQNGIYAEQRLSELLGVRHVIGGYAATPASIISPGVVQQFGQWCTLGFGEMDDHRSTRVEAFLAACQAAGIDSLIEPDIQAALWSKFIFITTHSGATSFCRSPVGPIRSNRWGRQLLIDLSTEATTVARAKGVNIKETFPDYVLKQIDNLPPEAQGSMCTDLQRGARLELEWLNGLMIKIGEEVGVPTPSHRALMQALDIHAMGSEPRAA